MADYDDRFAGIPDYSYSDFTVERDIISLVQIEVDRPGEKQAGNKFTKSDLAVERDIISLVQIGAHRPGNMKVRKKFSKSIAPDGF